MAELRAFFVNLSKISDEPLEVVFAHCVMPDNCQISLTLYILFTVSSHSNCCMWCGQWYISSLGFWFMRPSVTWWIEIDFRHAVVNLSTYALAKSNSTFWPPFWPMMSAVACHPTSSGQMICRMKFFSFHKFAINVLHHIMYHTLGQFHKVPVQPSVSRIFCE